ncbi:hypothetical protein HK097_008221 [Rhizophlyctis rosea]|uniref:Uncharacterized protein n=1 Tax=Rhizophlyctis rosea TaxID=64517 RepID=A0AAD5X5F1_9FUNG|nr:hypothetical protein HK097_008221 [Rhizophlyctis rosea]
MPATVTESGAFTPSNRATLPIKTHFLSTLPASALRSDPSTSSSTSTASLAGETTRATHDSYIAACSRVSHVAGSQAQLTDMWELGTRDEIKAGWFFSGRRGDLEMFLPRLGMETDIEDLSEYSTVDPLTGDTRPDTTWYTLHSAPSKTPNQNLPTLPISIFSPLAKLQPVTATYRSGPDPDLFLLRIRARYPNELVSDKLYLGSLEGSILRIQIEKRKKHPLALGKETPTDATGLQPPKVLWYSSLTIPSPQKAVTAFCVGGGLLYAVSLDGAVRVLNEHGGSKVGFPIQLIDSGFQVTAMCVDPYAKRFFTATEDGVVCQWAMDEQSRPMRNRVLRQWRVTGDGGKVTAMCSTHGRVYTAVDREGGVVREWVLVGEEPVVVSGNGVQQGRRNSEVLPMYDSGEIRVPEMQKTPSGTGVGTSQTVPREAPPRYNSSHSLEVGGQPWNSAPSYSQSQVSQQPQAVAREAPPLRPYVFPAVPSTPLPGCEGEGERRREERTERREAEWDVV